MLHNKFHAFRCPFYRSLRKIRSDALGAGHNLHLSVALAILPNGFFGIRDLCYYMAGIRDFKAKWGRVRDAGYRKYKS